MKAQFTSSSYCNLTNSSRGIQHAWHFWYAFDFCVEVQCGGLVIACFTP
ncbi:DUF3265 domain-containing protein [Vibrio parahaemolyticus]|nr:DUF3265 domain-containing protein [Vibrio parahaemolyticus]EJG1192789.1 DUF3265 domain-containing protein [Vibrio parahaemolyticus]EJU9841196.1 DUF3265 domain-containing protein [Vibrio parahaemolyticus]EKO5219801.1 DUF3265 domain-containing protein [Vibrio parahaemolyticus]